MSKGDNFGSQDADTRRQYGWPNCHETKDRYGPYATFDEQVH